MMNSKKRLMITLKDFEAIEARNMDTVYEVAMHTNMMTGMHTLKHVDFSDIIIDNCVKTEYSWQFNGNFNITAFIKIDEDILYIVFHEIFHIIQVHSKLWKISSNHVYN